MNIFQKKSLVKNLAQLPHSPVELYQHMPYKEGYGYLRGIQEEVLNSWNSRRIERDVICKMSTGSGKTLTGLLMLKSLLVEGIGPCLYVCPDYQLLAQTVELAGYYGIPVCTFESNTFPPDFINGKSILICPFHKFFNGKSIFIREKISLGGVLLDDAHKCVDLARDQTTISIERNHLISKSLFSLFSSSLKEQIPGTFARLEYEDPTMVMKVPYWTWMDNRDAIIKIINDYVLTLPYDSKESIKFSWNFIMNNLLSYDCYFGGNSMEISPIHVPYHEIPTWHEAKHRFILSATFEDDYDLIRDLGISLDSILNPINPIGRKDVGKRLIIGPSKVDPKITDDEIRKFVAGYAKSNLNVVALVSSWSQSEHWKKVGAEIVVNDQIGNSIERLKNSNGNFMVFANRYDGMDLHNDSCRILIIDGLPKFISLREQYEEGVLESMRSAKKAQIVEQGLGRASRSGGDFSVVFLMGSDLLTFMSYEKNMQYFTDITRAQIEGGMKLLLEEDISNPFETISETARYCLTQDQSWLEYHNGVISAIPSSSISERKKSKLRYANMEKEALTLFRKRLYEDAGAFVMEFLNTNTDYTEKELAWYYQFAAQLFYNQNKLRSHNVQVKANAITTNMFFPPNTPYLYRPIKNVEKQSVVFKNNIEEFSTPYDLSLFINNIKSGLQYSELIDSNVFENKLFELGKFLGFSSQRPDKETGTGPDCLWCLTNKQYLILEAKSRLKRDEISKSDIEQLLSSEVWFNRFYSQENYTLITLQKSNKKRPDVNVNNKFKVLDQVHLDKLHSNLDHLLRALHNKPTNDHDPKDLEKLLILHGFTSELFIDYYLTSIR